MSLSVALLIESKSIVTFNPLAKKQSATAFNVALCLIDSLEGRILVETREISIIWLFLSYLRVRPFERRQVPGTGSLTLVLPYCKRCMFESQGPLSRSIETLTVVGIPVLPMNKGQGDCWCHHPAFIFMLNRSKE